MFPNKYFFIIGVLSFLISCKSSKIDSNSKLTKKASAKEVLALHKIKVFKFKTLQSKLKVNYDDGKKAVSPSITLRMEKGKQILISAKFFGFTGAKIYITPDRVSFYEKLNKRFYDGDFAAISGILGTEVDFEKIQNLFLGQSIIDPNSKKLVSKWQAPDNILVQPKKQDEQFILDLLFNISNAKVAQYNVNSENKSLSVSYPTYQKIEGQDFPEEIKILAKQPNRTRKIDIIFKNIQLNGKVSFPYSIPEGYTEFKL